MLVEYIERAMSHAEIRRLEDGTFGGEIPACPGTIAFGKTEEGCRSELRFALEDWIIAGIRRGDAFPEIDGVSLNPAPETAPR